MWKLVKAEFRYSMVSILAVYGSSFLLLSLIVGFVAIKPGFSISKVSDLSKFVLFFTMLLPQFAVLSGISKDFEREKRMRLILMLPLTARNYIFCAWSIIILLQMATFALGISFALAMYFIKSCSLFNTVLGLCGVILTLSGLKLLSHIVEGTTRWFKSLRGIRGMIFVIILFGGIFFNNPESIVTPFEAIYTTNGIVFLHLLGVFFMLTSYSGLKRISAVK
jgi:hypothetical protein